MNRMAVAATIAATSALCAPIHANADPNESGLQEYASVNAFADDLTKHGHPCSVTPKGGGAYAVDSGICTIDGQQMVLSLYTSQSQIDGYLAQVVPVFANVNLDYGWLSGKNWTLNCKTRAECQKIQADLGGSIVAPLLR